MVSEGVTRTLLPANNEVICTLHAQGIHERAAAMLNTRSATALELWRPHLEGALVAIGKTVLPALEAAAVLAPDEKLIRLSLGRARREAAR